MDDLEVARAPDCLFDDPDGELPDPCRRKRAASRGVLGQQRDRKKLHAEAVGELPCFLWVFEHTPGHVVVHGCVRVCKLLLRSDEVLERFGLQASTWLRRGAGLTHRLIWVIDQHLPLEGGPQQIAYDSTPSWNWTVRLKATAETRALNQQLPAVVGVLLFAIRLCTDARREVSSMAQLKCITTPTSAAEVLKLQVPKFGQDADTVDADVHDLGNPVAHFRQTSLRASANGLGLEYEFTFPAIADALQIQWMLKGRQTCLDDICRRVFSLTQPVVACRAMDAALLGKELRLPSETALRRAAARLDMMLSLWHRRQLTVCDAHRYLSPDSSPQAGHNILCVTESSFVWPIKTSFEDQVNLPISQHLNSRCWPLSTMGLGAATSFNKGINMINIMLMESTVKHMEKRRREVLAITSDQGAEATIVDMANMDVAAMNRLLSGLKDGDVSIEDLSTSEAGFEYPNAIFIADHCHMIFGACQEAFSIMDEWVVLGPGLRAISQFFGDEQYRNRFVQTCVPQDLQSQFTRRTWGLADWKWEYMHKFLGNICPVLDLMVKHYNSGIINSAAAGMRDIDSKLVVRVGEFLQTPGLSGLIAVTRAVLVVADSFGTWCEGCACHEHLLHDTSLSRAARLRAYQLASSSCQWKGRRGNELASGAVSDHLQRIATATEKSVDVQNFYVEASDVLRQQVRAFDERGTGALLERLRAKLHFWSCLPHSLLGVFQTNDIGKSKIVAQACLDEFQQAVAAGIEHKIHRVARAFLHEESHLLPMMKLYVGSDRALSEFPELFVAVRSYALSPIVSRRVEGMHATIKRCHRNGPSSALPHLSCKLRQSELKLVLQDPVAFAFLEQEWGRRGWLNRIILPMLPEAEHWLLKVSGDVWKHNIYYQCSRFTQFRALADQKSVIDKWTLVTMPIMIADHCKHTELQKMLVRFLKDKLSLPGVMFSMPGEFLNRETDMFGSIHDIIPSVQLTLAAAVDYDHFADLPVFFSVTNAHPELRKVISAPHQAVSGNEVEISLYTMARREDGPIVVVTPLQQAVRLDLVRLASAACLPRLTVWISSRRTLHISVPAERLVAVEDMNSLMGCGPVLDLVPVWEPCNTLIITCTPRGVFLLSHGHHPPHRLGARVYQRVGGKAGWRKGKGGMASKRGQERFGKWEGLLPPFVCSPSCPSSKPHCPQPSGPHEPPTGQVGGDHWRARTDPQEYKYYYFSGIPR